MMVEAKHPIATGDGKGGKIIVPKNSKGSIIGVSNSVKIKAFFPLLEEKVDGWYYIVSFPPYIDEILCLRSQLNFL